MANYKCCKKCGKYTKNDKIICKCGSNIFIKGNNFTVCKKEIICYCDGVLTKERELENKSYIIQTEYKCKNCGNKIIEEQNIGKSVKAMKIIKRVYNEKEGELK